MDLIEMAASRGTYCMKLILVRLQLLGSISDAHERLAVVLRVFQLLNLPDPAPGICKCSDCHSFSFHYLGTV